MADRYWVGGSGSWNSTSRWSATSGGASGASVPTASDNAIFDANSGTAHYTVTVTDNATCANLTFTPEPIAGVTQFVVGTGFVIAGTFSTSGTQGNRRVWFRSSTYGLLRDMQIATIGTVTDVDFRDIRVTGTGGTLTGTRIGDLGGNFGITFSTPKNCYRIGTGNWSDDQWSDTSGGTPSTDFFPLAQDAAVFDESTTAGTHTMNSTIPYAGTVDMSARTSALTLSLGAAQAIYGGWTLGSGITLSGAQELIFSGRNTQTITSAGKTFSGNITVDSYGGSVELADALNIGTRTLTVTNGTFDTKGYNVTAGVLSSNNSNVREIKLGASTVTLSGASGTTFATATNLTFNAGTSTIVFSASSIGTILNGGGLTFYDVSFTGTSAAISATIAGSNTFNSLSITAPATAGCLQYNFDGDQTITGTLTASGASAVRRVMLRSNTLGTPRTLTVGTLSADDCDFRDITIAGTAAGGSPTRAGDCGGNSGVNFPAPKTVYWNLSGTQDWSATAWATTSGGTPALDNFPLAQDTAVFDNTGAAGTVNMQTFNIGSVDMSARTSAMTMAFGAPTIHGSWSWGAGVTSSNTGTTTFSGRGTSTITSGGNAFSGSVTIDCVTGTVQLADALEIASTRTLTLTSGAFDAVSYNVTTGLYVTSTGGTVLRTLKMGSGLWTLSGVGTVWSANASANLSFYPGTADILLSSTSTSARTFAGGNLSYNKLTIGGATGTSTTSFTGNNTFTELASTKTVAHTIGVGSVTNNQTFGKWSVTGSAGNVVTLTGTGSPRLIGSCTDGIDYLAMGSLVFTSDSTAEFYAGANSTGTAGAPVYRTAKPADSTRYWVGGTGNWNDTNRWSTTSGGSGGASLPRSHDDVVFDANSSATAYTATVNAITGGNRCKSLTIAGPASGNVTLAGSTALYIHDDITLPATGMTRTYSGQITLSGTGAGKTITTNGQVLNSSIRVEGVGAEWSLGSALTTTSTSNIFFIISGSFSTANYGLTTGYIAGSYNTRRALSLGSSVVTLISASNSVDLSSNPTQAASLTFSAGTSEINTADTTGSLSNPGVAFHNVTFTSTGIGTLTFGGAGQTFNNLSFAGKATAGVSQVRFFADQAINGTLTISAGTNATCRTLLLSDTVGTPRTLTCAAVSATDTDFRDITITGAAAPVSGVRLGNCEGNTGIIFAAGVNKYWNLAGNNNWSATAWATSSGGAVDVNNFPLPQDTCIFGAASPNFNNTITIDQPYHIGTIDMSARTTNAMLLRANLSPVLYGDLICGTGSPVSDGVLYFTSRAARTITSAGNTIASQLIFQGTNGTVTLQDALTCSSPVTINDGTFDANGYNVTLTSSISSSSGRVRTIAVGSGLWTLTANGSAWNISSITTAGLTVTGTGTIRMTSALSKTFEGGDLSYAGITLDQGGAGGLTVTGNNSFANISNTYSTTGATSLLFGTTTQRVANFTATGEAGRVLTIRGSSGTNPCNLIHTGAGDIDQLDYLTILGVRAYQI